MSAMMAALNAAEDRGAAVLRVFDGDTVPAGDGLEAQAEDSGTYRWENVYPLGKC